jgi:hypothetical protein
MNGMCSICGKVLRPGARIFQISVGRCIEGSITPTYEDSDSICLRATKDVMTSRPSRKAHLIAAPFVTEALGVELGSFMA